MAQSDILKKIVVGGGVYEVFGDCFTVLGIKWVLVAR